VLISNAADFLLWLLIIIVLCVIDGLLAALLVVAVMKWKSSWKRFTTPKTTTNHASRWTCCPGTSCLSASGCGGYGTNGGERRWRWHWLKRAAGGCDIAALLAGVVRGLRVAWPFGLLLALVDLWERVKWQKYYYPS
jgi:hypothetical protein